MSPHHTITIWVFSAGHYHLQSHCCRWQVKHGVCCCISKHCFIIWHAADAARLNLQIPACLAAGRWFCATPSASATLALACCAMASWSSKVSTTRLHRQFDRGLYHSEQSWPNTHTVSPAPSLVCLQLVRRCSTHSAALPSMLLTCCQACYVALHAVSPCQYMPVELEGLTDCFAKAPVACQPAGCIVTGQAFASNIMAV